MAAAPSLGTFDEFYRRELRSVVALAYALSGSRTGRAAAVPSTLRVRASANAILQTVTPFERAIVAVLDRLQPGEVVTYGEVADEAGFPGAARAVGRFLHDYGGDHPWWRVVAANGRLVPGHEREHTRRLRAEGVKTRDGHVVWPHSTRVRARGH